MPIPPVVQRIWAKGIPDENLRGHFRASPQGEHAYSELFSRIAEHLGDSAIQFVHLSRDDPYWDEARASQNFEDALCEFLLHQFSNRKTDERILWCLAGLEVRYCTNDFGRTYWVPLVARDAANVRWLVESAGWVWWNSGYDPTRWLRESLESVSPKAEFRGALKALEAHESRGLARAAGVALSIMQGGTIPKNWPCP